MLYGYHVIPLKYEITCPKCKGIGETYEQNVDVCKCTHDSWESEICPLCGGTGKTMMDELDIPGGIEDD